MAALKKVKSNRNFWTVLLVCVALLMVLIGGARYVDSLRSGLMAQAIDNVLTVTRQQQQSFDVFISGDRERLHSFAGYFAKTASADSGEIKEKLSAFADVGASYTVINLSDGTYYNNMSDEIFRMDAETLKAYQSLTGEGVRNSYSSLYTQESMFGYYAHFTFADGVPAMIQKSYSGTKVSEEFSLSFYDGEGLGFVATGEGQIVLRSVDKSDRYPFDNVFDMLAYTPENQANIDKFIADVTNQETGVTILEGRGGDYIYTYVPIQSVENWYLISVVPSGAVMREADQIILSSRAMLLVFMALVAVFLTFYMLIWRNQRDMEEKNQEIKYREGQFDIFTTYLADSTDDIYILLDIDGRTVDYISPNVERLLGIPASEIEADPERINTASVSGGEYIGFETLSALKPGESLDPISAERINVKTQEHRWFRETAYCVSLQGRKKAIVYISDRTNERRAQDTLAEALDMAQVANKAKTTFLGSVSHDIRTPMNAIMGLTVLLREDARDPERVLEYTQRIDAASQHLLGLINDVLDMNKIEEGGTTLNISEINLAEIIDEMNIIIRPQTRARQQTFEIFASSFAHEHLLGDRTRINQILINILSNAVKYTQEGGRIEMSVTELPQVMPGYSHLRFIIKDNGQGMSEDYLKVIFDPFSREQNASTDKIQGTGLGMAIT
ncbi:MAG: hybrid sensor histidine kinase/response regulator, partial [Oscillospiraceae bacterium]|nr:hybrid sensor histidine kinase/response regulator [Oscillospiraceae bacterium]